MLGGHIGTRNGVEGSPIAGTPNRSVKRDFIAEQGRRRWQSDIFNTVNQPASVENQPNDIQIIEPSILFYRSVLHSRSSTK